MLAYARWKYILVSLVLFFALLLALPNVFGDDRALQIARKDREPATTEQLAQVEKVFKDAGATYKSIAIEGGNILVRFDEDAGSAARPRHRQGREVRADEGLRQRDDVCLARAALDAGPAPARHAAGPGPARRPLPAVRSGHRRRGRTAGRQLRAGFPSRAARGQDPVQRHQRAVRRFGREQWRARVAARGRRPRPRCAPCSTRHIPISSAATPASSPAPRSIA